MEEIKIQRAAKLQGKKPDPQNSGIGKIFFPITCSLLDYPPDRAGTTPASFPYGPLYAGPSAMVFHYAQEVFEGLKAYRAPDGSAYSSSGARRQRPAYGRLL